MKPLNLTRALPVLVSGLAILLTSCWGLSGKTNLPPPDLVEELVREEAYVPIYDTANVYAIKALPPAASKQPGKIYVWGNLLFQVDNAEGIHVIDYTDRKNPVKIGFIKSRGCSELAVRGNYLVTNNMSDLVTIDVSSPAAVKEVGRLKNVFSSYNMGSFQYMQPPERGKYFKCPDYRSGDVVGWKLEKNVKTNCYY